MYESFVEHDRPRMTVREFLGAHIRRSVDSGTYDRALEMCREYGPRLSGQVAIILFFAIRQGQNKFEEILDLIEEHYKSTLRFQLIEHRGVVSDSLNGFNRTQDFLFVVVPAILGFQEENSKV